MYLENKVILLTGGTGSFGNKFVEIFLKEFNPKVIRVYSRDELKQLNMRNKFSDDKKLRFFIGDVRDKNRLHRAMKDVNIVVHAAALKQVPACEYNPIEAVKTNIEGAINIIDTAIENNVEKVIAISTDKAVHPINLYGATKLVAEKLFVQGNAYTGSGKTKFSCARYGNVVGSRGSVIPIFMEQRRNGKITITDKRMTRFWITLEQGVRFVLKCIDLMRGGEIFVPKIPSMKILDLADVVAPGCEVEKIGIRPGEKISEILITEEEAKHTKEMKGYFIIEPNFSFWDNKNYESGKPLKENFKYTSDNNDWWLTKEELEKMITS